MGPFIKEVRGDERPLSINRRHNHAGRGFKSCRIYYSLLYDLLTFAEGESRLAQKLGERQLL